MLKGVIFDMDGVLVDNMKFHKAAFAEMARRYGVDMDIEMMPKMAGKDNEDIFGALFPPEVVERVGAKRLGDEKEEVYRELYAPSLAPVPGLVALIEDFRARGIKRAVGTSAMTLNVNFVLDGLGLRGYFDALVTHDMVTRAKPDPEIYLRALSELGLGADECLVFEDAVAGIEAARAAGIKVVALSTTIPKAQLEQIPGVVLAIADFTQLKVESGKLKAC